MSVLDNFFEFRWEANRKQWSGPPVEALAEYSLAVIEFDDQGWYHDLAPRDALLRFLDDTAGNDLLILVFVHGWKHNAQAGDGNLRSFRGLLRDARASEDQRGTGRRVLGVYLSWRGRSLSGNPLWMNASFWTRKSAAFRVAVGSVREISRGFGQYSGTVTARVLIIRMGGAARGRASSSLGTRLAGSSCSRLLPRT